MAEGRSSAHILDGAWRRVGLSVDGEPFAEHSDVLWLQVGRYFADLRAPWEAVEPARHLLDAAQAFTGRSTYDPPTMTWRHDLDTMPRPPGHEDTARMEHHGSVLVERGKGYIERWQREATAGTMESAVAQRNDPQSGAPLARLVLVAELAVAVWAEPAAGGAALAWRRGVWAETDSVGAGADAGLGLFEALGALTGGTKTMAAGWRRAW